MMKLNSVVSENGEIYYVTSSLNTTDRCIVFLHGLSADHTLFDKQTECFSDKYNLIIWDAPMHGLSRPYKNFTYENCARELKRILDKEGFKSAVMVGQSMGGYCIQEFIKLYPDMVSAFIGIDTCPFGEEYYTSSDYFWLKQVGWMSMLYTEKLLKESIAKSVGVSDYAYENMKKALSVYSKKELCALMDIGYRQFIQSNRNIIIKCPVLIIAGERDKTGKVLKYCKAWHEKTGYPYVMIKNAAHNSNADNPEQVNKVIFDFLKKNNL